MTHRCFLHVANVRYFEFISVAIFLKRPRGGRRVMMLNDMKKKKELYAETKESARDRIIGGLNSCDRQKTNNDDFEIISYLLLSRNILSNSAQPSSPQAQPFHSPMFLKYIPHDTTAKPTLKNDHLVHPTIQYGCQHKHRT